MTSQSTLQPITANSRIDIFLQNKVKKEVSEIRLLKGGIWIYFILLIFEGAIRKWLLPELSTPLLIIRDPVAVWLIYKSWQLDKLKSDIFMSGIITIGIVGIFTAYLFGHGNLYVALFGARIFLIHFPLIFVIGNVFTKDDVIKLGKATLWIAVPMAVLIGLQFFSPQTAWVNRGVGGDETGAGFSGALGFFRPPGTFSFTNGNSLFFNFVACFVLFFWLSDERFNKLILISSTIALLVAIPLSMSRGLFFSIGIVIAFAFISSTKDPKYLSKILGALIGLCFIGLILSQTPFFQTALNAFITRFTLANETEGGVQNVLVDRYLGGLVGALSNSSEIPYFGYGLGMGTNVGAILLTGKTQYLIAEGEWGRLIGELGALLGIVVIFIRVMFSINFTVAAYKALSKKNILPWMLSSFVLLTIPQGQWGQATSLGFGIISGGLLLASFRD